MKQELKQNYSFIERVSIWLRSIVNSKSHILEAEHVTIALVSGLVLANPNWNTFASSPSFVSMAQIGNELYWGILMICIGVAHLLFAIYDLQQAKRITILLMACIWGFIATMQAISNTQAMAPYVYGIVALFALLSFWRISYEKR